METAESSARNLRRLILTPLRLLELWIKQHLKISMLNSLKNLKLRFVNSRCLMMDKWKLIVSV